jgi:outer membrane protein assembly factor BamB
MSRLRLACLALIFVAPAYAEDWPEFRGPTAQGHSRTKNLPVTWSAEENVAWRTPIPGGGWSSPVLVAGKLYLTAAVPQEADKPSDLALVTLCLDAKTGKALWDREVFREIAGEAPKIHSKNSHASPTPIVADGRIYVHFGHQGTACLSLTGEVLWKTQEQRYAPVHGNGGSPVLVKGNLIFSCDGASDPRVVALNAENGELVWSFKRPGDAPKKFAFCTPLAIEVSGQTQVIIPGADSVSALNPQDGSEIWRVNYTGYSVIPRPIYGEGLVFLSTSYDAASVMAIRPDGKGDVTETHVEWTLKKGAPHTPSLLLVDGGLYMVSDKGVLTCVEPKTGKEIWQQRIGGNFSASPVYADGKIYLQSEEGKGLVIKPGPKFEQLGENGFGERTLASYAIGDGAIFVRTAAALYRVQQK